MAATETLPLAGIRVLDLTKLLPGPLATLRLRELGAEVVKIEGPSEQGQDDGARHMLRTPAEMASGEPGLMFRRLNAGKQLLRLDLRSDAGRGALLAMVRDANVLVEGFRPGVMVRLGLGWDVLRAANPRLVMCAISGYGQHGPWADRAGHDINYIAMAGVLEQIASEAVTPPARGNRQIEDMGFAGRCRHGVIADHVAVGFVDPHAVTRTQGIGEITLRPWVFVARQFDPVDAWQVGLVHRTQTVRNFEHGTHADCLLRRSSTVSATLSRR